MKSVSSSLQIVSRGIRMWRESLLTQLIRNSETLMAIIRDPRDEGKEWMIIIVVLGWIKVVAFENLIPINCRFPTIIARDRFFSPPLSALPRCVNWHPMGDFCSHILHTALGLVYPRRWRPSLIVPPCFLFYPMLFFPSSSFSLYFLSTDRDPSMRCMYNV